MIDVKWWPQQRQEELIETFISSPALSDTLTEEATSRAKKHPVAVDPSGLVSISVVEHFAWLGGVDDIAPRQRPSRKQKC